ncbi:hypothetical protein BGX27_009324 [Mortierella sp. AM989]|nr:hypothetical protein BGX27_009324 [Mortierella sp. AM989]
MPAGCSHSLGLGFGLAGPLVLNVITAPAERIKLLLQTQDEIILNLREESLAAHHHHHSHSLSHSHSSSSEQQPQLKKQLQTHHQQQSPNDAVQDGEEEKKEEKVNEHDDQDDEEEEEPRSIIVPYAQLPYTTMQDCAERLVEKEGTKSLWRGYSLECSRLALQTGIETMLHKSKVASLLDIRRIFSPSLDSSLTGSATWILAAAIEGTAVSTVALLAVYPLAVLQTRMAVDVVRRTRSIKKVIPSVAPAAADTDITNNSLEEPTSESIASSFTGVDIDSVEWVEHTEGGSHDIHDEQAQELLLPTETTTAITATTTTSSDTSLLAPVQEYVYTVSYKYRNAREIAKATIESSEGHYGLYKGFSTVVVSTFISRIGFLTLYRTLSPLLISRSSSRGMGAFLLVFGATSIVNLLVYPLSTVCHRRMVAAPGRYSSSWDAGKQIVEKHGWKALYKGVEVAMVRSTIMAVLSRVFY